MEKTVDWIHPKMLARNRFLLLVVVGGVVLAIVSVSLQFLNLTPAAPMVEKRPATSSGEGLSLGKSRKRVFPVTQTQEPDPISEAYSYCNTPNRTEQAWEGHSPADYKLLSVHVMIRHGDRYPLYYIPKTKRPPINCTLSVSRYTVLFHLILRVLVGSGGSVPLPE
ncbi:2-phosphoxylose phosphatase 1, partial [Oryzias melastigma]|uniref:2-phosphoxylose phosphatase 1 n=1 Tax=Oryzias melastigma TaxID=30732 RepID=UPI00168D28B8